MSKVFTSKQFVDKCKWLANDVPTVYYSGDKWCTLNENGKWRLDCVLSIKSLLWGFRADKNLYHGGAVYKANGVEDFTCNGALNYCTDVSNNFNNLVAGEYLCMKDTPYNHSGIYLGNGKVFESTTAWGTRRCIISEINNSGIRSLNGVKNLRWTWHGKLNYIDYSDQDKPTPSPSKSIDELAREVINGNWGNGEERKRRLTEAGYDYRTVQNKVNEMLYGSKKYIQINARLGVWCRTGGYGFNYPKYKVIPNGTKCELLAKNVGYANGYNWDKVIYDGREVYLPNAWNKYL